MRVTLLLGGQLRDEATGGEVERALELEPGAKVTDAMRLVRLAAGRVKLILVNGRGATLETPLSEGDRVALFPPELSFNTFVSLSFRRERVEARERERKGGTT